MAIQINIENLEETIILSGDEYVLLKKGKGEEMLDRIEQLTAKLNEKDSDLEEMKKVIISVLDLLGLLDETKTTIRAEIQSGEESYFKYILKALNSTIMLITKAQFSKGAQAELEQKFSFIKNLLPVINKYAQNGK